MKALLKRDIVAEELAMSAPPGEEGYPADHVIGRAGTQVVICDEEELVDGDGFVEVENFSEDSFAVGFVRIEDLELLLDI